MNIVGWLLLLSSHIEGDLTRSTPVVRYMTTWEQLSQEASH